MGSNHWTNRSFQTALTLGALLGGNSSNLICFPILFSIREGFACMNVCTACIPGARGSQKCVLDSLERELGPVGSHHVGTRNQTRVLWQSSQCS